MGAPPCIWTLLISLGENKFFSILLGRRLSERHTECQWQRHVGRTGQLRRVDTSGGGWGHINFDDVRFE
jgi:uncharacterized protein YifE (UPF0438 family)